MTTATHTGQAAADTRFGPLQQINAGLLDVGYAKAGPADGPAVCTRTRLLLFARAHEP